MDEIHLRAVTHENWRETLELAVRPEQQRFVSDRAPIAAIALAKAYIRPGGMMWAPYAIYAGATMVGFLALAYEPDTTDQYWIFHCFVDQRYQGHGYGRGALQRVFEMARREHPRCCNWWFTRRTRARNGSTPPRASGQRARNAGANRVYHYRMKNPSPHGRGEPHDES